MLPATATDMFFELDSADLTASDTASLDRYAAAYTAVGASTPVTVVGYASVEGEPAHNTPLSVARAKAVASYLASKGVPAINIKTSGVGETNAFSSSDLRENRRAVISPEPPSGGTSKPATSGPKATSAPKATSEPSSTPTSTPKTTSQPPTSTPPDPSSIGFPINVVIPVETEVAAWNGKIKLKYKGKITFEAVIGGSKYPSKTAIVITADSAKLIGLKASQTWWEGKGKLTLGGIPILEKPAISTKEEANKKDGVTVKAEFSVGTVLGTAFITGTVFQWKPGSGSPKVGTIEGGLKGNKIPIPNFEVDGVTVHDIFISADVSIEVAPQYVKIIADEIWDSIKGGLEDATAGVTGEVAIGFAIDLGLVLVAVGVVAGTAQSIAASADLMQLNAQVGFCYNSTITGITVALRGDQAPGDAWGKFGYRIGQKVVDDAIAKATAENPDASPVDIRDAVLAKTSKIKLESGELHSRVVRIIGDQFWHSWADANHGYGTNLGDAKQACASCYQRVAFDIPDNDPDLAYWVKQSKLPGFLK